MTNRPRASRAASTQLTASNQSSPSSMTGRRVCKCPPPTVAGSTPKGMRNRASVSVPRKSTRYPSGGCPDQGLMFAKLSACWRRSSIFGARETMRLLRPVPLSYPLDKILGPENAAHSQRLTISCDRDLVTAKWGDGAFLDESDDSEPDRTAFCGGSLCAHCTRHVSNR